MKVAEGTRTPDHRDHNPELYQLSYRHREAATGYRTGSGPSPETGVRFEACARSSGDRAADF